MSWATRCSICGDGAQGDVEKHQEPQNAVTAAPWVPTPWTECSVWLPRGARFASPDPSGALLLFPDTGQENVSIAMCLFLRLRLCVQMHRLPLALGIVNRPFR